MDNWGLIPGRGRNFFSIHHPIQISFGAHPASYPMGTRGYFEGKMAWA